MTLTFWLCTCGSHLNCRVCRAQSSTFKAVRLYTITAEREKLKEKLEIILGISISVADGLPQQICQRCARCIRGAAELRAKAHESQGWYLRKKRTKDTAGDDASPNTLQSRPPAKRRLAPRCLDMGTEEDKSVPGKQYVLFNDLSVHITISSFRCSLQYS